MRKIQDEYSGNILPSHFGVNSMLHNNHDSVFSNIRLNVRFVRFKNDHESHYSPIGH